MGLKLLVRRRSHIVKIIILIPILWLGSLILFSSRDTIEIVDNNQNGHVNQALPQQQPGPQKVAVVQGFGPPMALDPVEKQPDEEQAANPSNDVIDANAENQNEGQEGNIPKPNRDVLDMSLPFYKKGDPDQPGELGKAVKIDKNKLTFEEKKKYDDGFQKNAFNQYASDMISIHRSLPVPLDEECVVEKYSPQLPDTSVIICFHNEAWSVLLRTVHSVIERTPDRLLREVILVDDFSDMSHTKKALDDYMAQFPKVKILRLEKREGLIRARLRGAAISKGDVLTYLDSHCECMEGWIEPLLDRIQRNKTTVVCPVIDVIDDNTFQYHYSKAFFTNVGGFDWSLQFNWHPIPERDRKNRTRHIDPVRSPTMAGGLFSIHREYFEKLGTYDPGFDIWGGENLELSFKIWMCGGTLEIVPCSHVGHIFRKRSPYKWRTGVNVLKRNSIRLAEVWLDDYKQYYYERINNQLGDFGDISQRKALRNNLGCKSFRWYLDNIFPELFVPGEAIAKGEVRNGGNLKPQRCLDCAVGRRLKNKEVSLYPCHSQGGNQIRNTEHRYCVDSAVGEESHNKPVVPYGCHQQGGNQVRNRGGGSKNCLDWASKQRKNLGLYWCHNQGGNQYWMYSKDGEIRRDESCVDYAGKDVVIFPCHGMKGNQEWKYDHVNHQLLHVVTRKCLQMTKDGAKLIMTECDTANEYQHWTFKEFNEPKAREYHML